MKNKIYLMLLTLLISTSIVACSGNTDKDTDTTVSRHKHTDEFVELTLENKSDDFTIEVPDEYDLEDYEGSDLLRDPQASNAEFDSERETEEIVGYDNLDYSMFDTESSISLVKQMMVTENASSFDMFHSFEEYSADILTKTYYVTFDYETVYYIYEQNGMSHGSKDSLFTYDEVVEMLRADAEREW